MIRAVDYREADRILTIFNPEYGEITATVRGCRQPKSKKLAASQLFCYAQFELSSYKGRYQVTTADVMENFYNLSADLLAWGYACVLLSVCARGVQPGQPNPRLFTLLVSALKLLSTPGQDVHTVAAYALLHAGMELGYAPQLYACARCGNPFALERFSVELGGMLCDGCAAQENTRAIALPQAPLDVLRNLYEAPNVGLALEIADKRWSAKICRLMIRFLEYHMEVQLRGKEFVFEVGTGSQTDARSDLTKDKK